jgi:F0F1-type ATP synthase membrane subunit c/vacuolar-type H+-ATPase subunit K
LQLLWAAQLSSVVVLVVVCGLVTQRNGVAAPESLAVLRPAAWIAAMILAAGSIWWRRAVLATAPGAGDLASRKLQASCIAVWAMSEAVAVIGLVLGMLAGDLGEMLPLAGAAATLLYVHRPAVWSLGRSGSAHTAA